MDVFPFQRRVQMDRMFTAIATKIASAAGQPLTFIVAVLLIVGWALSGPVFGYSDTWQLVVNTATTVVTFLMVFLIQNSQNRAGEAMQAKLDELLRAVREARGKINGIANLTDHPYEPIPRAIEKEAKPKAR